jgi:hypothetical protein
MKLSTLVLGASLSLNVAIVALSVMGRTTAPVPLNRSAAATDSKTAPRSTNSAGVESSAWAATTSDDPAALLDRLRAAGFPLRLLRAIATEQVRQQFAPRRAALEARVAQQPFWESGTRDPQLQAALQELQREQEKALQELLGSEAKPDDAAVGLLRRRFPDWPDDKIAAIELAQKAHQERMRAIRGPAEQFAAEKIAHEEVAALLTKEELDNYELRTSRDANTLRSRLAAFDATEQEFRTLFALQRAYDANYSPLLARGNTTPEAMRERRDAQVQLNEQIRSTLGDERFAAYQRSADASYQQTSRLVARLELPPVAADQLYAVQQDVQQRATTLRTDRTLTPEDRNAQLAALAAEAETKATTTLGSRGFEAYKQYGGSWLQNLQPRPAPPRDMPIGR